MSARVAVSRIFHPFSAHRLSVKTVYAGSLFQVKREQWRFGRCPSVEREVVLHPGSVVLIPVLDLQRIVLIHQYRVAAQRALWELPAGTLESGESVRRCAVRELMEETGYRARHVCRAAQFWPSPGFCNEVMYLCVATGLTVGARCPADDEPLSVHVTRLNDALRMIRRGVIADAKTIIGILFFVQFRETLTI